MRPGAVQIAGVRDAAEAEMLVSLGVDFLGFPLRLDLHAEDCSDAEATRIVASLPEGVESVLITYLLEPAEIARLARSIGVGWVQLHGAIEPAAVKQLRALAPELHLAKSLVVRGSGLAPLERSLREALAFYDAGEYARAARGCRDAGNRARLLRRSQERCAALVAECTAWLRAERMTEFGSCTGRLAALEGRGGGRDRAVNTLIALGAIADGRPVPAARVPAPVDRMIRKAAGEGA